jgi:hypothetical protein
MMAFLPKYGSVDRVVAFDPSIDDYKFELNTFEVVVQTHLPLPADDDGLCANSRVNEHACYRARVRPR